MASDGSSSGGSFIGGLIGGVIGFFVSGFNPAGFVKGFMYGSTVGGLLMPPTGPDQFGPRIDSLKITTSSNVATLPRAYGKVAHTGNIIWAKGDEYIEVATVKKVKTGLFSKTKVTTYSYYFTGAIAFARSEATAILRVWHQGGNELVYSSTSADIDTQIASGEFLKYVKFYYGTSTQGKNPLISAAENEIHTSAYRGVIYLVYNMYPLEKYQNNIGMLDPKVEYTTVDVDTGEIELLHNVPAASEGSDQDHFALLHNVPFVGADGADLWRLGLGNASGLSSSIVGNRYNALASGDLIYRDASDPSGAGGEIAYNLASHGKSDRRVFVSTSLSITATLDSANGTSHPYLTWPGGWELRYYNGGTIFNHTSFKDALQQIFDDYPGPLDVAYRYIFDQPKPPESGEAEADQVQMGPPGTGVAWEDPGGTSAHIYLYDNTIWVGPPITQEMFEEDYSYGITLRVFVHDAEESVVRDYSVAIAGLPNSQTHYCYQGDVLFIAYTVSGVNYITKILRNGLKFTSALTGDFAGLTLVKIGPLNDELIFVFTDGDDCTIAGLDFDYDIGGADITEAQMEFVLEPADIVAEFGDSSSDFYNNVSFDFNQMFYCLDGSVIRKDTLTSDDDDLGEVDDLILGNDWPSFFNIWKVGNLLAVSTYGGAMDKAGVQWFTLGAVASPGKVLLADIITAENALVGIDESDLDVTTIDQEVRGYVVSEIGPVRNVLSQLQAIFPFDVIQSGFKNKYVKRGLASVATVTWQELGQGISLTQDREMETQLPSSVELTYIDLDLDYQPNIQRAERRLDHVNIRRLNIPIVMTASEAAQAAEILLNIYHIERRTFAFVLPPIYRNLEPSDIITLAMKDVTYVVRLTNIHYLANGQMECTAKQHRETVYVSTAQGATGAIPKPTTIPSIATPIAAIFDMPTITDANNMAGYSAVMTSLSDSWPGGTLFRTLDNQASWQTVATFGAISVWGVCVNALSVHGGHVIDEGSELIVKPYIGEFASVTETQFLNEETLLVYGVPGRFEIIGYKDATDNMDGTYTLSYLMRGRKGTEQYTGTHQVNDYFALISSSKFIGASIANLDTLITNRAITIGRELDSGVNLPLQYAGVNLTPLSPVDGFGVRDSSENLTGYFTRRSRLDGGMTLLESITFGGVPLGEATESYEIDILDGDDVVRTIPTTSETFTYSAADQVTDFGSEQPAIDVNIYQISTAVGRGYAGAFTI